MVKPWWSWFECRFSFLSIVQSMNHCGHLWINPTSFLVMSVTNVVETYASHSVSMNHDSNRMHSQLVLIDIREVMRRIAHGKTWIYDSVKSGCFPPPLKIGRGSRWLSTEIDEIITRGFVRNVDESEMRAIVLEVTESRQHFCLYSKSHKFNVD